MICNNNTQIYLRYSEKTGSKNFKKHLSSSHLDVYRKNFLDHLPKNEDKDHTITSYLKTNTDSTNAQFKKLSKSEKKKVHGEKLALLACESYIPFNALVSPGFHRFLSSYGANLNDFPTDRAIIGTGLEDMYVKCLKRVKEFIQEECPRFCTISSDSWTDSHLGKTYINYNLIFFKNGELKTVLMEVAPYEDSKTAQNLNSDLKRVLKEFNIIDRQIFAVNDSAKNNTAAYRIGKDDPEVRIVARIGCIAHNIHNLVYTDIFNSKHYKNDGLAHLMKKLNSIHQALYYKKAEMSLIFKAECTEESWNQIMAHCEEYVEFDPSEIDKVPSVAPNLRKNNVTRWNSTLTMLKSYLPLANVIRRILVEYNKFDLLISDDEKQTIRELVEIFELFEGAVKLCQVSNFIKPANYVLLISPFFVGKLLFILKHHDMFLTKDKLVARRQSTVQYL